MGDGSLFKLFGIEVKLHPSWWFVFFLLAWSLSTGFFPSFYPELSIMNYWIIGVSSSLFLFLSVLFHEFSHSLVAKHHGIEVDSITLFFFGGVSSISKEEIEPWNEFWMALAGPLSSFFLAGLFYVIYTFVTGNVFVNAISFYLFQLNLILGAFNLVPAYPLDGGRVFRALLHIKTGDLRRATKIAATGGKIFAWTLIFLGLIQIFGGNFGGLWLVFLGIFLQFIAGASYQQVIFRHVFSGWKVSDIMQTDYTVVESSRSLKDIIENHKRKFQTLFVVKKGTKVVGVVDLNKLGQFDKKLLSSVTANQVVLKSLPFIQSNEDCGAAYALFAAEKTSALMVAKGKRIVGVIFQEDLMNALQWHMNYGVEYRK